MNKFLILLTPFIFAANFCFSQCSVNPYIEANYTTDAWILVFRNFVENPGHPDYDTPILDSNKIIPYLEKLSAVYEQVETNETADSLFNKFSIHVNPRFPEEVVFSKIVFTVNENVPWVLNFIDTGISGEPILDQLVQDYSFTITEIVIVDPIGDYIIELTSSISFLNTYALLAEFGAIDDINDINTGISETPYNYNGIFFEINNEEVRSCNIEVNENIMTFSLQTENCWNGCPNAKSWEANISEDCSEVIITLDIVSNHATLFSIYPNPASDILQITGLFNKNTLVTIYNIQGQILITKDLENNSINVSGLPSGIHFLVVQTNDGKKAVKNLLKTSCF